MSTTTDAPECPHRVYLGPEFEVHIACTGDHEPGSANHAGIYPNSQTRVSWHEDDRRDYTGEFARCPVHAKGLQCRLPYGHRKSAKGNPGHAFR